MFALLKKRNPYAQAGEKAYASVLAAVRAPKFYQDYGVPDTFDGRFDFMLLHIFIIMHVMLQNNAQEAEVFNQAVFDATFADMDQTLREMGIGDMGVPKHMRKMMKAFNGRMNAYEEALAEGALEEALRNNLYGTVDDVSDKTLSNMAKAVRAMIAHIQTQDNDALMMGQISFEKE